MNHRFLWRCLLTGSVLALSLGLPIVDNPLTLPTAYWCCGTPVTNRINCFQPTQK